MADPHAGGPESPPTNTQESTDGFTGEDLATRTTVENRKPFSPSDPAGRITTKEVWKLIGTLKDVIHIHHDTKAAPLQLPWVYASLQTLSGMRACDPITSIISAIQVVLKKIQLSYELPLYSKSDGGYGTQSERLGVQQAHADGYSQYPFFDYQGLSPDPYVGAIANPSMTRNDITRLEVPKNKVVGGCCEGLIHFTQSDIGQNLDFTTMNLQAFLFTSSSGA